MSKSDWQDRDRKDSRELRGDDNYYGGARSQREDWSHRAFDNEERDRGEGMYEAGGRDFKERLREAYEQGKKDSWWSTHNPISGDQPWYENSRSAPPSSFTGGDRGWADRRGGSVMDGVKDFFGVGPKGYSRTDERIQEEVCESLARHPGVDARDIEVSVQNGHVSLRGTVPNRWMRRQAEDAVEFVPGVVDVHIELSVSRIGEEGGSETKAS